MKTNAITLTAIFAAILCVLAPISIPMVPVPITLATLGVYIIGALFDFRISPLVVMVYILLGAMGLPVFSNGQAGIAVLAGPTAGYIFGYILCAFAQGLFVKLFKGKAWAYPVSMVIGTILLYTLGTIWFMVSLKGAYTLSKALMVCVVPFLLGDSIKILFASVIGYRLKPRVDAFAKRKY